MMKCLGLTSVLIGLSTFNGQASDGCSVTRSGEEFALCADSELRDMNGRVEYLLAKLESVVKNPTSIEDAHGDWLDLRTSTCGGVVATGKFRSGQKECFVRMFRERIDELQDLMLALGEKDDLDVGESEDIGLADPEASEPISPKPSAKQAMKRSADPTPQTMEETEAQTAPMNRELEACHDAEVTKVAMDVGLGEMDSAVGQIFQKCQHLLTPIYELVKQAQGKVFADMAMSAYLGNFEWKMREKIMGYQQNGVIPKN